MNWMFRKVSGLSVGSAKTSRLIQTAVAGGIGFLAGLTQFMIVILILYFATDWADQTEDVVTMTSGTAVYQATVTSSNEPSDAQLAIMSISMLLMFVFPIALALWYWFKSASVNSLQPEVK